MAVKGIDKKEIIKSLQNEAMKEFYVRDGSNRVIEQYQAPSSTPHDGASLKTSYSYVGTTNLIEKMKEEVVPWDSAWDL